MSDIDNKENYPLFQTKTTTPLERKQADNMFPRRPAWLELDDIIARRDLFKNLKGFMTYGSPLSKFAVVWPAIVPINKDNSVFDQDFEWINVYDPTDPVADKTKHFDLENYQGKKPQEIAYKAESIHLYSHIKYLTYNPKREYTLVKQVALWLLKGNNVKPIKKQNWGWPTADSVVTIYQLIRYLIWLVVGLLISGILSWLVPLIITQAPHVDIFSNPLLYFLGAAVIVFFFGIVARLKNMTIKS